MIPSIDSQHAVESLTGFIRKEVEVAGLKRAVVGVSGGIDSALSLTLSVEALGKDRVTGLMMPYRTSSAANRSDAESLIKSLGVRRCEVNITPMVEAVFASDSAMDKVRRGNVMARVRMIVLYDLSAREEAMVVGTSNRTEILLGYGTLHGDTACGINPLGNLFKAHVRQLAATLHVPAAIINKPPTADLWEGQTDEGELGITYDVADEMLYLIERKVDDAELVSRGFDPKTVAMVRDRMSKNAFKRRLAPLGPIGPI
jgi:NAD+ synthase